MSSRGAAIWLWLLLGAFCFRVLAQLVQWGIGVPSLPPFEAWQSGALPYPILLAAQIAIALLMARVAWRFSAGAVRPSRRIAYGWLIPGSLYLTVMITRLVLGQSLLQDHSWIDRPLPSIFHLVLASFMIVAGLYHYTGTRTR